MLTPRLVSLGGIALLVWAGSAAHASVSITSTVSKIHGYVSVAGNSDRDSRGASPRTGVWAETFELNASDGTDFGYLFCSGGLDLTLGPSAGVQFGGSAGPGGSLRAGFSSTTHFTVTGSGEPIDYTQDLTNFGAGTVRVTAHLKGPSGVVFVYNDLASHYEQRTLPVGDYEYTYQLDVNAGAGVYTQPIGLGEIVFANPPCLEITQEPESHLEVLGSTTAFQVAAQGEGTLTYQWERNGVALADVPGKRSGSLTPNLTISNCQLADRGLYRCVVSAPCRSLPSKPAQLSVAPGDLPGIASASAGYDEDLDDLELSFSVEAVSAASGLAFAWRLDNVPLTDGPRQDGSYVAGANTPYLSISDPGPASHGTYTCVVSNVIGSTTSDGLVFQPATTDVPPSSPRTGLVFAPPANPLRGPVSLRFSLAVAGDVRMSVFDAHGRRVTTLLDESLAAGEHSVTWDGRDGNGRELPAGVVWCVLEQDGARATRPLVILR